MSPDPTIAASLIATVLLAGLVVALEICFYFGQRARRRRTEHPDQLATIQAAMLGLLALLLGWPVPEYFITMGSVVVYYPPG